MKIVMKWLVALLSPACLLPGCEPALGQTTSTAPAQICMSYTHSFDPNAVPYVIFLPADQHDVMASRGYVDQACPEGENALTNYRTQICQFVVDADENLQSLFAQTWQATPRELCDYANALAGS